MRALNNGRSAAQDRRFWAALARDLIRRGKKDREEAKRVYRKITEHGGDVKEKLDDEILRAKEARSRRKK